MIIEFIIGVGIFPHEVLTHSIWVEDKPQQRKLCCPKTIGSLLQYHELQERYPVGFVIRH